MIILNEEALLQIEEYQNGKTWYTKATILYYDGTKLEVGTIKKGNGNIMYDKEYVYLWPISKGVPSIFSIKERKEIKDNVDKENIFSKYSNSRKL